MAAFLLPAPQLLAAGGGGGGVCFKKKKPKPNPKKTYMRLSSVMKMAKKSQDFFSLKEPVGFLFAA